MSHIMCHISYVTYHISHVTCHMSHVTCHMSHVTCPMSHVTYHMSHVTCHMSHIMCHTKNINDKASCWSVRYQWGPTHLVYRRDGLGPVLTDTTQTRSTNLFEKINYNVLYDKRKWTCDM